MKGDDRSKSAESGACVSELDIELLEARADLCDAKRRLAEAKARTYPVFAICTLIILASLIGMKLTSS